MNEEKVHDGRQKQRSDQERTSQLEAQELRRDTQGRRTASTSGESQTTDIFLGTRTTDNLRDARMMDASRDARIADASSRMQTTVTPHEAWTIGMSIDAGGKQRRRLLCYYGDDFTGSTDVLESLFRAGLKAVLFLEPPTSEQLEDGRFVKMDAFGVAGVGRSLTPDEMERELNPIFETLKAAGAAVVHYKVCSTFDSLPHAGSIGKAAEIGRGVFGGRYIPLLVGVPYLKRYTLFGHHYAAGGGTVHRLDRHPTMSRHPVTPMDEADLRLHLQRQTELPMALMDITELEGPLPQVRGNMESKLAAGQPALLLFDVLDEQRLETAGRLIWEEAGRLPADESLFVIGSSGVEYALGACWKAEGLLPEQASREDCAQPVNKLLVVSGSCSPVTETQIKHALGAGFAGIRVPVHELIHPGRAEAAREQLMEEARSLLAGGGSVVLYSAMGPSDASIGELRETLAELGIRSEESSRLLGMELGVLAKRLIAETGLTRLLIAGGDTSGYVMRELNISALECMAALTPGGPLCRAYSADPVYDGLELVLKGGQVGGERFFEQVLHGR